MLKAIDRRMSTMSRGRVLATALACVAVFGVIDVATGYEFSFSIFYLVPVALSAWYAGRLEGIVIAVLSASVWYLADALAGHMYSSRLIAVWNALVRFGYFSLTVHLLSLLRGRLDLEQRLARTDALSGVLNRRAFREQLDYALAAAARSGQPLTLAYIDLDDFKRINDTLGHAAGDDAIRAVARTLSGAVRRIDVVARLGGDEFALLLPDTDRTGAEQLLRKARQALQHASPRADYPIRCSIGAVTIKGATPGSDEALGAADALMYQVKYSGKDSIECREYTRSTPRKASPDAQPL